MTSAKRLLFDAQQKLREYRWRQLQKNNVKRLRELRLHVNNVRRLRLLRSQKEYYKLRLDRERQSRKFKVKQNVYKVTFRPLPERDNSPLVRRILRNLLIDVKGRMQCRPNDYLRLNLHHPSLDSDIWFEFTQCKNLNEATILNKIEAVQQSKKDFTITDGAAELEMFHVKYQQGSGGNQMKHLQGNRETFKSAKRSILRIQNDDTLCLPRAIVVARLHAQKPSDPELLPTWKREWDRIRRRDVLSPEQKKQAVELRRAPSAISINPAGLTNGKTYRES